MKGVETFGVHPFFGLVNTARNHSVRSRVSHQALQIVTVAPYRSDPPVIVRRILLGLTQHGQSLHEDLISGLVDVMHDGPSGRVPVEESSRTISDRLCPLA